MDYRENLKHYLLEKKQTFGKAFSHKGMAEHCRVQKTYLSTALGGKGHLNEDQVFLACDYLNLSDVDREEVETQHKIERSVSSSRVSLLKNKLKKLRATKEKSESHIDVQVADQNSEKYFFDPNTMLAHMFLTVESYRLQPKEIQKALDLSDKQFAQTCQILEELNIIKVKDGKYLVLKDDIHLPSTSPICKIHQRLMRLKSLERQAKCESSESYSLSITFSSDEGSRQWVKEEFFKFLKKVKKKVGASDEKEVYQMNFDLFPWG